MPSPTPTTPTRPQTSFQAPTLRVKTYVKAGALTQNHNEMLVRPTGLKVKSHVKAGGMPLNHAQTLVRAR